jgi:hypothetical protein
MDGHDSVYHKIFGHPGMVAQLLHEFVAEPWLDNLDLDGIKRLNAKFHSDTGERREGDMIWRIPRRGGRGDNYLNGAARAGLRRSAMAAFGAGKATASRRTAAAGHAGGRV